MINIAILGYGYWGPNLVRNFNKFPECNISYIADKDITVATVPVGYADGVPRALSNKIFAELNGQRIKQIGNITMDQMMFDITGVEANEGDIITLLNDKDLSIDNWANILGTINYELTCRLKVRLPRVYVRG